MRRVGKIMLKFKDKVVVVTGGASGIGLAICRRFGNDGAKIGILDMDADGVKRRARELEAAGTDVLGIKCDVTIKEECDFAINEIINHFGGIDILVNNAGITQRDAFVNTRISVFRKVMEVNFFGSLYCTKASIASLIKRKGLIIVIESVAGVAPLLGRTGYCASKHALHGLFTSLRSEIRETGTHVMIVCPGFIKTNLQKRALGGDGKVTHHPQTIVGKQNTTKSVAEAIYKGAVRRKHILVLTAAGKAGYWISRIAPVLYERMMARKFRSELIR